MKCWFRFANNNNEEWFLGDMDTPPMRVSFSSPSFGTLELQHPRLIVNTNLSVSGFTRVAKTKPDVAQLYAYRTIEVRFTAPRKKKEQKHVD